MFSKLREIEELRKTNKLVAEEDLRRLEEDYELLVLLAKVPLIGYSTAEKGLSDEEFKNRSEELHKKMVNISDEIGTEYIAELQPKWNFKRKTEQLKKYLDELDDLATNIANRY